MFDRLHIEKDKAVFYDERGNKIKRSVYYDADVGNYFIYNGDRCYFDIGEQVFRDAGKEQGVL